MKMNHWYSNEFCTDSHARTQEQLQEIAKRIRANCKVVEIAKCSDDGVCTKYENESLGIRYWVKDEFGHISEIDEARSY